jgi:hypothetical protein
MNPILCAALILSIHVGEDQGQQVMSQSCPVDFRVPLPPERTQFGAPAEQLEQLRQTFFAGAQHLYTSIMRVLDPGDEPTDSDLSRMGLIDAELKAFIEDFQLRHIKTDGRA